MGLVVQGADLLQAHQGNAVDEGPVLRRVHLGQEPDQVQEVVHGGAFGVLGGIAHLFVGAGFGSFRGATVSIVLTIDAQYVEVCGQSLDLAQEVFGSEASFAEFLGQRVGGRREKHTGVDELAEQGRHQDGVPRIIEFELVNTDEAVVLQHLDCSSKTQQADEVGVFHESPVGLRSFDAFP